MSDIEELRKYEFLDSLEGVPVRKDHRGRMFLRTVQSIFPGLMVCTVISLAAMFLSEHYGAPTMLLCLLLGMAFHFMSQEEKTKSGINFTAQAVLRFGVILIGARIMLSDFTALGVSVMLLVIGSTIAVIALGVILSRALGLGKDQGFLIGGATAICGASAALAISSILPKSKDLEYNTLLAVIGVTLMGTLAMIAYPVIIGFLAFNDTQAGIIIGGTIHDVSQVVGAGYSVSEDAGDTAILVKLMRVFMLVPLLIIFAVMFNGAKQKSEEKRFKFPLFLLGFILLVMLNSFHLIPAHIMPMIKDISKWMLIMAVTAVGMKTSLKALFSLGWKPIFLICAESAFIFAVYFGFLLVG